MPFIASVAEAIPKYKVEQEQVAEFSRKLFKDSFKDIERLLHAFHNGCIEKRHFVKEINWYEKDHSFKEKNDTYIEAAIMLGSEAITNCLTNRVFLLQDISCEEIDAIIMISSTGISTPSIEARIMNMMPFSEQTKRIPIWGLGCAGGASGLSRAYEYCRAYPKAKVLVLTIELCSLTFQKNDTSKSNLIGTSLFADGVACSLVVGDEAKQNLHSDHSYPKIIATQSTLMKDSLEVMGWDIRNDGFYVIFSRDIPAIIEKWLKPNVIKLLDAHNLEMNDINHFIAHPGGKKVLDAYEKSLQISSEMTSESFEVLRQFGNMSSSTILYVLKRFLSKGKEKELGLATALGPGFSSELLLLRWE